MKLLRFRGWAMYGNKGKCSYFINQLGPDAQHRYFNSQSAKSEQWLNLPRSPLSEAIMSGKCDLGYLEEYILSVH